MNTGGSASPPLAGHCSEQASLSSTRQQEQHDNADGESGEEDSLGDYSTVAAGMETVASMPIQEIQLRQERVVRRSLNNDELMLKIVLERIAHDEVVDVRASSSEQLQEQSALQACAAAGVPGAYEADVGNSPASTSRPSRICGSSAAVVDNSGGDDDEKAGERPVAYYEQAFARDNAANRVALDLELGVVGAIAVPGPGLGLNEEGDGSFCSTNHTCSETETDLETSEMESSADLTVSSRLIEPSPTNAHHLQTELVVAAEVAPEMLDLERSITQRVRLELECSMRVELVGSSRRVSTDALQNTPVAEILGTMDQRYMIYQQQQQHRKRKISIAAGAGMIMTVVVAIVLGVVLGTRDNDYHFPPDHATIADVPETICYERIPMLGRSELCPPQRQGSGSTNLVAESRLWNVPQAEISILNAGEVRIDMEQGNFTMGEARELLLFGTNTLVLIDIKGAKLVTALERGIQKIFDDKAAEAGLNSTTPSGAFPYGAGIRWNVNMSKPFPRRLFDVEVNPRFEGRWESLDLHRTYTIVTNSYLAGGGDSYHEFSSAEDEHAIDTTLNSLESFVEYCHYFGVLLNPQEDHYSTQTYVHSDVLFEHVNK